MSILQSKILILWIISCVFICNNYIKEYDDTTYLTETESYDISFKYSFNDTKSGGVVYVLEGIRNGVSKKIKVNSFIYHSKNKGDVIKKTKKVIKRKYKFKYILYFTSITILLLMFVSMLNTYKKFSLKIS